MTLSPIVAVVVTGLIRKSLWMSATTLSERQNRERLMARLRTGKSRVRFKF